MITAIDPLDDVYLPVVAENGWFHRPGSACVEDGWHRIGAYRARELGCLPCPTCYPGEWKWSL